MSSKLSAVSKTSYDRCSKSSRPSSSKSEKCLRPVPKKVVTSKKITPNCVESKSCPNGVNAKKCVKPKKVTKSESTVTNKFQKPEEVLDYCKKCGDEKGSGDVEEKLNKILSSVNIKCVQNENSIRADKKVSKPVQQYYKNEHFYTHEEHNTQDPNKKTKVSLDTIKEISELHSLSSSSILEILTDSEDEDDVTYMDPNNDDSIQKLKEFRKQNYFECHSAKSRIQSKGSATSLQDHKCVYRFYLNDRLFPVPLNTDHNNKIRCVQCHLPMDMKQENSGDKINGTIQAKVKFGEKDPQDIVLLLPIQDSLIIEERRKENRNSEEYVYFGVVKLSPDGNSMFNKNLPENSLALKYQKGYQERAETNAYKYKEIKEDDVIII